MESSNYTENKNITSGLEIASLVMSIISLLTFTMLIPPIIFGSLAVIFALLSRGASPHIISRIARTGLLIGSFGAVIGVASCGVVTYSIMSDPSVIQVYDQMYQDIYDYYYNGGEYPNIEDYLQDSSSYDTL